MCLTYVWLTSSRPPQPHRCTVAKRVDTRVRELNNILLRSFPFLLRRENTWRGRQRDSKTVLSPAPFLSRAEPTPSTFRFFGETDLPPTRTTLFSFAPESLTSSTLRVSFMRTTRLEGFPPFALIVAIGNGQLIALLDRNRVHGVSTREIQPSKISSARIDSERVQSGR